MTDQWVAGLAEVLGVSVVDPGKVLAELESAATALGLAQAGPGCRQAQAEVFEGLLQPETVEALAAVWAADQGASIMPILFRIRGIRGCARFVDELTRQVGRAARSAAPAAGVGRTGDWAPETADSDVVVTLDRGRSGQIRATDRNIDKILRGDPRLVGRIEHCQFRGQNMIDRKPIADVDEHRLSLWLDEHYGIIVRPERVGACVALVAADHSFHPVREYLDGLTWDGVDRLPSMLVTYWGAGVTPENEHVTAAISKAWLISMVARSYEAGAKVDSVVVLQGDQGAGKSTSFRVLMPRVEWFDDSAINLAHRDAFLQIRGKLLYEFAEMAATRPKDVETVKAFLTCRVDRYRPPYGRNPVEVPRSVVFCASTNSSTFLVDQTGDRRFWPVAVGSIDLEGIERDRDQLWAEAVHRYRAGEPWWLTQEEEASLRAAQEAYRAVDPWEPLILEYLRKFRGPVLVGDLLQALQVDKDKRRRGDSMRVSAILGRLGYLKRRRMRAGERFFEWAKPGEEG